MSERERRHRETHDRLSWFYHALSFWKALRYHSDRHDHRVGKRLLLPKTGFFCKCRLPHSVPEGCGALRWWHRRLPRLCLVHTEPQQCYLADPGLQVWHMGGRRGPTNQRPKKQAKIKRDLHIDKAGLVDVIDNNNISAVLIKSSN